jgi:hypothetical protein
MGRLCLGGVTEIISRTKALEDYSTELDGRIDVNDQLISENTNRLDEQGNRLGVLENVKVVKGKSTVTNIPDINLNM